MTDIELNEVAGGDPFGNLLVGSAAVAVTTTNTGFNIGSVNGAAVGLNTGTVFG